jgi:hypothetical protein
MIIFHVLHAPVHVFAEPCFQPFGISIQFFRFGNATISKTKTGGCLFNEGGMYCCITQKKE